MFLYHRISDEPDPLALRPRQFREQVAHLAAEGYHAVDASTALDQLYGGTLEPNHVAITFDDGFKDIEENALSVLVEFGFSASVFVATDVVDGKSRYSWAAPDAPMLRWDEIRELDADGVLRFEPHSLTHPNLTRLDETACKREIDESKIALEDQLRRETFAFCYPGGFVGGRVRDLTRDSGFRYGITCEPGLNTAATDPHLINRVQIDPLIAWAILYSQARGSHDRGLDRPARPVPAAPRLSAPFRKRTLQRRVPGRAGRHPAAAHVQPARARPPCTTRSPLATRQKSNRPPEGRALERCTRLRAFEPRCRPAPLQRHLSGRAFCRRVDDSSDAPVDSLFLHGWLVEWWRQFGMVRILKSASPAMGNLVSAASFFIKRLRIRGGPPGARVGFADLPPRARRVDRARAAAPVEPFRRRGRSGHRGRVGAHRRERLRPPRRARRSAVLLMPDGWEAAYSAKTSSSAPTTPASLWNGRWTPPSHGTASELEPLLEEAFHRIELALSGRPGATWTFPHRDRPGLPSRRASAACADEAPETDMRRRPGGGLHRASSPRTSMFVHRLAFDLRRLARYHRWSKIVRDRTKVRGRPAARRILAA